jgi:group I intron endonuclease
MERVAVYEIVNNINNKVYVGISNDPIKRWKGHKNDVRRKETTLYKAMRKHGIDNFSFNILNWFDSRDIAKDMEHMLVDSWGLMTKGYNMHPGGGGGAPIFGYKRSAESVEKTRQGNLGKKYPNRPPESAETKAKRGAAIREAIRKKKEAGTYIPPVAYMTEEDRKKIAEKMTGQKRSAETKAKLSANKKAFYQAQREAAQ